MTPKQKRFVDEFVVEQDAVAAYERAGDEGKGRSARNAANRLLQDVGIKTAIHSILVQRKETVLSATKRLEAEAGQAPPAVKEEAIRVSAALVIKEAGAIAFSDIGDVIDFSGPVPELKPAHQIPEHARRAISSVRVRRYTEGRGEHAREVEIIEFRLWPKMEALRTLIQSLGMLQEKTPIEEMIDAIRQVKPALADHARRMLVGDEDGAKANLPSGRNSDLHHGER
jgi:phage terminase small subunit